MTIKRIIMDIDDKLHKRLKDCSIKDDRTLNSTIKKVLLAGIGIVEARVQSYDDDKTISQEQTEITQYGKVLTVDERLYFKQNPSNTLEDYNKFLVNTGHKPVIDNNNIVQTLPNKDVTIMNDIEHKEFIDHGIVTF